MRFVVAYSGGLDSTVLLHAARGLIEAGGTVQAVHVHHHLQADADDWAAHCQRICRSWNIPCVVELVQVAQVSRFGVEGAARRARYAALARYVDDRTALLTAHQRDDQAETVLLQLMRGAGVEGLAGIASLASFGQGRIARPLLGFPRSALLDYAQTHGLAWIEDPSNRDVAYRRNEIRHRLLPSLEERWPRVREGLTRAAAHAADAATVLDEVAQIDAQACATVDGGLSVEGIRALTPARARNVLRHWLRRHFEYAPAQLHLREIERLVHARPRSGHALVAWADREVHRYLDTLYARVPPGDAAGDVDVAWDGTELLLPSLGVCLSSEPCDGHGLAQHWFEAGAVRVRRRQGGETCRPRGRGHTHRVKKLLQEQHVPPWRRSALPLIYVRETLAAVADLCVCEPFGARAGEPGRQIVVRELSGGEKVVE